MASYTQLPSGKTRSLVRKRGITKSASFATKREAVAWSKVVEAKLDANHFGMKTVPKDVPLSKLLESYAASFAKPRPYHGVHAALLVRHMGDLQVRDLTRQNVERFAERRLKTVQAATIAISLRFLGAALAWGRDEKNFDLDDSVVAVVLRNLSKRGHRLVGNSRDRLPTTNELSALYAFWAKSRHIAPMEELCRVAASSAMRRNEILSLRKRDLDIESKTVLIRQRKHPTERRDQVVPVFGEALELLARRAEQAHRMTDRLYAYSGTNVSHAFAAGCAACDIEDLHFHDLRHLAATTLVNAGVPLAHVRLATGHSSTRVLERYVNLKPSDLHDQLARVGLS